MRKLGRLLLLAGLTALAGLILVACGGGSSSSGGTSGGTATVLMGTAPDYLDPQEEYTTQGAEPNWISYTPLVTYKHENAPGGNELIPGLATALPQISSDQKTYTLTLRKGLVFSNGQPVKASDFKCTVERMIKVNWGGKSFVTDNVVGATDFDEGKANDISGITTDDATGKITIQLEKPYGAFSNVLAFPELGSGPVRDSGSHDHAGSDASGRRAVHDHGHRPEQVVQRRQEPEVRGAEHPGHPDGSPRPDQCDDRVEHPDGCPAGAQQPGGQLRRRRHPAAVAGAADPVAGEAIGSSP